MTTTLVWPHDLSARLANSDVTVLDVRSPGEYASASIGDSAHLPLDQLPEHSARLARGHNGCLALVCRSGRGRSRPLTCSPGTARATCSSSTADSTPGRPPGTPSGREGASGSRSGRSASSPAAWSWAASLRALRFPKVRFLSGAVGAGLTFAAVSNTCAMGKALLKLPYKKTPAADTAAAVEQLTRRR